MSGKIDSRHRRKDREKGTAKGKAKVGLAKVVVVKEKDTKGFVGIVVKLDTRRARANVVEKEACKGRFRKLRRDTGEGWKVWRLVAYGRYVR